MKKSIIFLCSLFSSISLYSQVISQAQTVIVKPGLNSAETEMLTKNADNLNDYILEALKKQDWKKSYYYIDYWVNMGHADSRLYMRFAEYLIGIGEPGAAKRKYMRAYKKFGCYDCKELADKL